MTLSYHLENIWESAKNDPRHYIKPTEKAIKLLKVGDMVRLYFVLNFEPSDRCRAERMWLEISAIEGSNFKGYLTNQPVYIKDATLGDVIHFKAENIAELDVNLDFDTTKKAIITKKALSHREINWVLLEEPYNQTDSGWQLFYGDETDEYLDNPENSAIVSLDFVLEFEPLLQFVFNTTHSSFEWDEDKQVFLKA
jgi:hypothetical protein